MGHERASRRNDRIERRRDRAGVASELESLIDAFDTPVCESGVYALLNAEGDYVYIGSSSDGIHARIAVALRKFRSYSPAIVRIWPLNSEECALFETGMISKYAPPGNIKHAGRSRNSELRITRNED